MEKKGIKDISSSLLSTYKKANAAIEKGNIDYGMLLLKNIIQKEPGFMDAREKLRKFEKEKAENMGGFAKFLASLKSMAPIAKGQALKSKKPLEAMKHAEEALLLNLNSLGALNLLADSAENAGADFIAIEAMEIARQFHPEDENVLRRLKGLYEKTKQGRKVLEITQQIVKLHPGSLDAEAELRAAAAMAAMDEGGWEEAKDYRDIIKDEKEAVKLEQEDRIARNIDDVRNLIAEYEKQIAAGNESVDLRRKLAEYYYRAERYEDAINTYNWITEKMGTLDLAIDKAIEKAQVGIFRKAMKEIREQGGSEEQIRDLANQEYSYRLERAQDRVNRFPNDTELHYELGTVYFEGGNYDKALEHFQMGQRNPHYRLDAMVYMGQCFREKGQYDLAVEEFNKALSEMMIMDKQKMNALYQLAITYEQLNDNEKAMQCFKEIYQADMKYKDVKERMDRFYQQQK